MKLIKTFNQFLNIGFRYSAVEKAKDSKINHTCKTIGWMFLSDTVKARKPATDSLPFLMGQFIRTGDEQSH